jgi:hypothetical protein
MLERLIWLYNNDVDSIEYHELKQTVIDTVGNWDYKVHIDGWIVETQTEWVGDEGGWKRNRYRPCDAKLQALNTIIEECIELIDYKGALDAVRLLSKLAY